MGHYRGKNYYRGENDAELQWLEDGANLLIQLFAHGILCLISGVIQIFAVVFKLITSDKIE
jgi:hypothetical protein